MSNKIIEILVVTWLHQNKTLIIKSYNYRIVHNFGQILLQVFPLLPFRIAAFWLIFQKG